MKFTGHLKEPIIDFRTGRLTLLFEPNEDFKTCYEEFKDCDKLSLEIKRYKAKRSLDANAYAWVLMTRIGEIIGASKEEVYEQMLKSYGTLYEDENGHVCITLKSGIDIKRLPGHWLKIKENGQFTGYIMIKGSSEYDTGEMSKFLDGIIHECEDLGIQTATPNEVAEMKQKWGAEYGKKIKKRTDR